VALYGPQRGQRERVGDAANDETRVAIRLAAAQRGGFVESPIRLFLRAACRRSRPSTERTCCAAGRTPARLFNGLLRSVRRDERYEVVDGALLRFVDRET